MYVERTAGSKVHFARTVVINSRTEIAAAVANAAEIKSGTKDLVVTVIINSHYVAAYFQRDFPYKAYYLDSLDANQQVRGTIVQDYARKLIAKSKLTFSELSLVRTPIGT